MARELPLWLGAAAPAGSLPVDHPGGRGANLVASARTVTVALGPAETQALLREVPEAFGARIDEALLAALALVFTAWSRDRSLRVDLESHGRDAGADDVDLSRTVGWFTSVFPCGWR